MVCIRHIFAPPTKRAETQSAWRACACQVFSHQHSHFSLSVMVSAMTLKTTSLCIFSAENRVLYIKCFHVGAAKGKRDTCGCQKCIVVYKWIVSRERLVVSHEFPGSEKLFPVAAPPDCRINAKNLIILHCVKIVVGTLLRHHSQIEAILHLPHSVLSHLQPYKCEPIKESGSTKLIFSGVWDRKNLILNISK